MDSNNESDFDVEMSSMSSNHRGDDDERVNIFIYYLFV